ncbi:MAG: hypothetical protein H7Z40_04670 [Phycisphaerae bacterium]|nr:hypothetical protein [Gemmatimonadaceae bacterium]
MFARTRQLTESVQENTLFKVLNMLTNTGTAFDLDMEISGTDDLAAAVGHGRGVFLATLHASLNTLIIRQLHDVGYKPMIIADDTQMLIPGTRHLSSNSAPRENYMLRMRSRLRAGGVVCAMIDRGEAGRRTIDVTTPAGSIIISPALFHVAERVNAAVIFAHVSLRSGKARMTFAWAAPDGGSLPTAIATQRFIEFARAHVPQLPRD